MALTIGQGHGAVPVMSLSRVRALSIRGHIEPKSSVVAITCLVVVDCCGPAEARPSEEVSVGCPVA